MGNYILKILSIKWPRNQRLSFTKNMLVNAQNPWSASLTMSPCASSSSPSSHQELDLDGVLASINKVATGKPSNTHGTAPSCPSAALDGTGLSSGVKTAMSGTKLETLTLPVEDNDRSANSINRVHFQ